MTTSDSPSTFTARALRLLSIAVLTGAPLLAQTWVQRQLTPHPSPRSRAPLANDVHRSMTVLFGGYDGTSTPRGDTWEFDGTAWAQRAPGSQPAARWGHGLAFDSKRGVTVLFGGFNGFSQLADTWEWNGATWAQRVIVPAPTARSFAGFVYDSVRGVCVLAGGAVGGSGAASDTWEYDGFTWTQRAAASPMGMRRNVAMAYDEVRRETLLFGGTNGAGTTMFGDLWSWNGATWTQRSTSGPLARRDAAMACDGNCGRVLLFGGSGFTSGSDAWAWDGVSWTQIGSLPLPAVAPLGMAHDAQRGQFVLLNGSTTGAPGNTWELSASCNRTMSTVDPAVAGQTARYRYDYPGTAANLHFCWTLITPRQPLALPVPIPGFTSIGRCRVDLLNQLAAPATFLDASGALTTAVTIPNIAAASGLDIDVQSVELDLFTLAFRWAGNDVETTIGPVAPPAAAFTATNMVGSASLAVTFNDASTQNPTMWQWDFDNDGTVDSTQQNPTWTYANNGVYSVRLVATNVLGSATVVRSNLVFVGVLPSPMPPASMDLVPIAAGTFLMGSTAFATQFPQESPVRQVTLTRPFWIGRCEVTQAQYQAVAGSNPSYFQGINSPNASQRPVEVVDWNEVTAYCQTLTANEQAAGRVPVGYVYRLPTEAEWEYCCRAGTTTEWHVGPSLGVDRANFAGALANITHTAGQTAVVGSYPPNPWGLHDMHGNVWERCLDSYATYAPGPVTDPCVVGGPYRAIRGGSWIATDTATKCRSAYRSAYYGMPYDGSPGLGFRIVLAPIVP